jgi:hypothetical protein
MFYPFREKGTTRGTTIFLYFAISELQFSALLRSLTKKFLGGLGHCFVRHDGAAAGAFATLNRLI